MSWDFNPDRRLVAQALAAGALAHMLVPTGALCAQPPIINIDGDVAADNEALYVAKNVLCFVRGKKSVASVQIIDVQHNDAGSNRASVVRLNYGHKKTRIDAVVTMEMVKKPGLRRIYQLTYRDDLKPICLPEQLLEVRQQVNTALERGDLLTRLTPRKLSFEALPLLDECLP